MGEDHVMGHNMLASLLPNLADVLGVPRVTNRDMRTTAIQALRMAKFSTEEVCKISRHKRASTVERNYNIGLHSDQRADMAAAIAQAPLLKRGHEFQPVSEHLPRKTSVGQVQMAKPVDWIPTGDDTVQKEDTMEEMFPKVEDEAQLFVDEVPFVGVELVVEEKDCSSLKYSQEEDDVDDDIERRNDR